MSARYVFKPASRAVLSVAGTERLFPVHRVYCVGRNYAAHAREMGESDREPPFFFSKPADAVTQSPRVAWPTATGNLHHEVELVVAIGDGGRNIDTANALDHVFGYAVGVDLTRRDLQAQAKAKGRPWDTSKGFDESAPVSEIHRAIAGGLPGHAEISLSVDGVLRQRGILADMIWSVPEIISGLSRLYALAPGDLIFTGTPEGVGALTPGSTIECKVEGLAVHSFIIGGPEEI